jgi:hypothetical protein
MACNAFIEAGGYRLTASQNFAHIKLSESGSDVKRAFNAISSGPPGKRACHWVESATLMSPIRNLMLSNNDLLALPVKPLAQSRNIFWDTFFYDISSLSSAEMAEIAGLSDHEGAIIVVSPGGSAKPLRYYPDTTAMLKIEKSTMGGVAIAGVGSSIVGTAALARNVADTYGLDIAGIISGYGVTDLMAEAMGGWFFYGYIDKLRHALEIAVENATHFFPKPLATATRTSVEGDFDARQNRIPRQLDSGTLLDILMANPDNIEIVVGHSKGAMLIDFVLEEFVFRMGGQPHRYYDDLHVVTVSAVLGLPHKFNKASQIIGALDWFGGMNSLADLLGDMNPATRPRYIENAWHHLNRHIPFKLGLVDALGANVPLH